MFPTSFYRFIRSGLKLASVLLMSGCFGACKKAVVAAPIPGSLVLVQGNNQQIQGGFDLPNPIVVRLLDADGAPIDKFAVGFTIVTGGGVVTPGSGLTDENGEIKTKWTLGPNETSQMITARVPGIDPVSITAIALLPTDLVVAQGNLQSAKINAALPNPIVVRVLGPGNVPMKGITVAFQVTVGGGLISPQSGITNALGEVTARWTMGATAGVNSLSVSSGSLQPVTLTALAQ